MTGNGSNNTIILGMYAHIAPQTIIFLFGILFTALASCWVYRIIQKVRTTFKEMKTLRGEDNTLKKIRTVKNKQSKHIFFLCFMLLFVMHICVRSFIYIMFVVAEYFVEEHPCIENTTVTGLKFIHSIEMFVFPMLLVSGTLFIAVLISLGTFLLFVRETYNYFGKKVKWIKIWIFIGVVQVIIITVLQLIPWLIMFGSVVLACFLLIDYALLIGALRKLVKTLNLKKIDATYKSCLKFRYRQCIKGIRMLSRPLLITLFVYIFGIAMEQLAVWTTLARCFVVKYYYMDRETYVDTSLLANIASFLWVVTYITIIQFYISFLLIALAYFCHSHRNRKEMENEQRRLISALPNGNYGARNESEA